MDRFELEKIEEIFKDREAGTIGRYRYFSVLFPLVEIEGELHILLEVRASNMRRQPGEVCFPGGKMENGETPEATAVRETYEELGILPKDIKLIKRLDSIKNYSGFTIYSCLGIIEERALNELKFSEGEVEEIFMVPLQWFIENDPEVYDVEIKADVKNFPHEKVGVSEDYHWRKGIMDIPIYRWEGKCIWGMTARMIRNFVRILKENI